MADAAGARAQSMGDVFSCRSAAVGAADKVVEMIKRVPRMPPAGALAPADFSGRVELRDVGALAHPLPVPMAEAGSQPNTLGCAEWRAHSEPSLSVLPSSQSPRHVCCSG